MQDLKLETPYLSHKKSKGAKIAKFLIFIQECIPVGCVPPLWWLSPDVSIGVDLLEIDLLVLAFRLKVAFTIAVWLKVSFCYGLPVESGLLLWSSGVPPGTIPPLRTTAPKDHPTPLRTTPLTPEGTWEQTGNDIIPLVSRQTGVKTLPSHNFVGGW